MRKYEMKTRPAQPPGILELEDTSPMPFGKHKGKLMQDVPADYLLWLYDNEDTGLWKGCGLNAMPVKLYVIKNIAALEMDAPDFNLVHDPRRKQ